ncbi:MAG: ABC transporter ATP-binding protein [Nitrospirota bacterium]
MKIMVSAVDLVKSFGDFTAVNHISIDVEDGKLVTFLGPSGSGKTTTMRMIAGLLEPDQGEVIINEKTVFSRSQGINEPAEKRDIGMVFQSYAIWPHLTVYNNIAYPLRIRKFSKSKITEKVDEILSLVHMEGLADRYPGELSGGQQQRVALARALVYSPRLLLLDEPLANLDAKVREIVRFELKEIQRRTGVTTIYVTHDQSEAMVLSDKVIVMESGAVVQEGTPFEIYHKPQSKFVADFIGVSNFIPGVISRIDEGCRIVETEEGEEVVCSGLNSHLVGLGSRVLLCIRPEDFELYTERPGKVVNILEGKIQRSAFLGNVINYWVKVGDLTLRVQANPYFEVERKKDRIFLSLREDRIKMIEVTDK